MDSCDAAFDMQFCAQPHLCHEQTIFVTLKACKMPARGPSSDGAPENDSSSPGGTEASPGASLAVRGSLLCKGHPLLELICHILQAAQKKHRVCCSLSFITKLSSSKIIKVKWRLA